MGGPTSFAGVNGDPKDYQVTVTNDRLDVNSKLVDQNGNEFGVKHLENQIRTVTLPYPWAIAEGIVPDHDLIRKFGHNGAIGASLETVWTASTLYTWIPTATILKISSGDVDDNSGGDGARTVEIIGLDANYDEQSEIVILTGQTAKNTIGTYIRIHRMIVRTAGVSEGNEGILYAGTGNVVTGVPANIYATVPVGTNQTEMALWTVPAGHTAFLVQTYGFSSASKSTEFELRVRPFGEVLQIKYRFHTLDSGYIMDLPFPLVMTEKSDVEICVLAGATGGDASAGFSCWYEDN